MTGILEANPWKQDQIMPWMVNVTEYPVKTMTASVRANISDKPVRQAGRLRGVLLSDKTVRQE